MPRGGTKGNRGGTGKARGPVVVGGRERMRGLVDDAGRIEKFRKALDRALNGVDALEAVQAYLRVFEHGYGRPPQALDVNVAQPKGALDFRIVDANGAPFTFGAGMAAAALPVPGEAAP